MWGDFTSSCSSPLPSAFLAYRSRVPDLFEQNAMRFPSGDHSGTRSEHVPRSRARKCLSPDRSSRVGAPLFLSISKNDDVSSARVERGP